MILNVDNDIEVKDLIIVDLIDMDEEKDTITVV